MNRKRSKDQKYLKCLLKIAVNDTTYATYNTTLEMVQKINA